LTATLIDRRAAKRWAAGLCVLAALLGLARPVLAEGRAWSWGARWSVEADTNPLRLREGQAPLPGQSRDDTLQRYALTGALDERQGRQRWQASLALNAQRQAQNRVYDGNGWRAQAAWDFATLERVSGRLAVADERSQRPDLRDAQNQLVPGDNPQTSRRWSLNARLGANSTWAAETSLQGQRLRFDNPASAFRNVTQHGMELGLRWRPSAVGAVGWRLRWSQARYPGLLVGAPDGAAGTEDRRRRQGWQAWAQWTPTGSSVIDLRLGSQRTRFDRVSSRDGSTPTAWASWTYRPTGKLAWSLSASQAAGQDADPADNAFSRRTQTLRARVDHAATGKLGLYAEWQAQRRQLAGVGAAVSGVRVSDRETTTALGARWQAQRTLGLGCEAQWRQRTAAALAALDESYQGRSLRCDVQWQLD
jgi:hypothetical protein